MRDEAADRAVDEARLLEPREMAAAGDAADTRAADQAGGLEGCAERERVVDAVDEEHGEANLPEAGAERAGVEVLDERCDGVAGAFPPDRADGRGRRARG